MPLHTHSPSAGHRPRVHGAAGYTLVEMMVTMALIAILGGMAAAITSTAINVAKSDASIVTTISVIEQARDRAIAERRNFELTFVGTDQITVQRHEQPGPTKTLIIDTKLDQGQKIHRFALTPDTPDKFGGTAAVNFGGTPPVMFTSDGSLIDSNGDPVNGTIFIADPNRRETSRAVTIFGVTGLIRSFKWASTDWVE